MNLTRCLPLAVLAAISPMTNARAEPAPAAKAPAPTVLTKEGLPTVWLQGEPVKDFEPGKLYIFEFWATWCAPCLQAMPHMESLYQKFKDNGRVRIVGVNVMDRVAAEKLLPFLKAKRLDIHYAMAADGSAGTVRRHWLDPLGVDGIPHAIALRDGKILWRGHPGSLEAGMVEAMAKPDYSADKTPPTKAALRAAFAPKVNAASAAAAKGDLAAARARFRELAAVCPEESVVLAGVAQAFADCAARERADDAYAMARLMTELYPESRKALLNAGRLALETEVLDRKDLALARECAERLLAKDARDVAAMEMKASALFAGGDKAAAIALQESAVRATDLHREIEAMRTQLAEAGKARAE